MKNKDEIENLKRQVNELQHQVLVTTSRSSKTPPSKTTFSSNSTYSLISAEAGQNHCQQRQDNIPQLDGAEYDLLVHPPHQPSPLLHCETCHEIFKNSDEYNEHDKMQFCCDDCGICYPTQIEVDLHVLQVHPDESYAKQYIPESTMQLFVNNLQPCDVLTL